LLPGGVLAYLAKDRAAVLLGHCPPFSLEGTEHWIIFLFAAYLIGHLVFLISAFLDEPYDLLRSCTKLGQNNRLAKGKTLSPWWMRTLARVLFKRKPDAALIQAVRIKSRALSALGASDAINAFQWSKARLLKDHGEGLVAVQRLEADSKFFRSFVVVLMLLTVFAYRTKREYIGWCICLLIATVWRYADQRFKSTQQAYWSVITLESMTSENRTDAPQKLGATELTHAGGLVYRSSGDSVQYLLVQASNDRTQWVLPKGHIELGETPRETAVREVQEESAQSARVIDWIDDARLGADGPLVRFFLMEVVEDSGPLVRAVRWALRVRPSAPYPEERQQRWLRFDEAIGETAFPETRKLLEEAQKRIGAPAR
jgi:8-oxo-dGTP pyrophosphatase MutT (NUDIX family)